MANKVGRPSDYTEETASIICKRIAAGKSLRKVCEEDDALPSMRAVMRWLSKSEHEEFRQHYARAQDARADVYFEETREISDDVSTEPGAVAKARLQVDTRKWICARMNPKKYSDKINIDANVKMTGHETALDELE